MTRSGDNRIQTDSASQAAHSNTDRLLERAQKLDSQALAQLHDRYYPAIYRYVNYRLEQEQLVEDISSEVFLRLLNHLHQRKGEIHDVRAWLLGTAANLINDHLRQKYRRPTENIEDHETLAGGDNLHDMAENHESQHAVREAMRRLTTDQQHVLALRFSQGFSVEETAAMMHKTAGAVKVLQFRALTAIRKLLVSDGTKASKGTK